MSADAHDIQREVKKYYAVFGALLLLTLITWGVSRLHLPTPKAIALGLAIAALKSTLVACFFMHLLSEKRLIYSLLLLTAVFFVSVLLLPVGTARDPILGSEAMHYELAMGTAEHGHAEAAQEDESVH